MTDERFQRMTAFHFCFVFENNILGLVFVGKFGVLLKNAIVSLVALKHY